MNDYKILPKEKQYIIVENAMYSLDGSVDLRREIDKWKFYDDRVSYNAAMSSPFGRATINMWDKILSEMMGNGLIHTNFLVKKRSAEDEAEIKKLVDERIAYRKSVKDDVDGRFENFKESIGLGDWLVRFCGAVVCEDVRLDMMYDNDEED